MKKMIPFLKLSAIIFVALIFCIYPEKNPNEIITTKINTKNSIGQTHDVYFAIPRKYFSTHVRKEGESIVLKVGYPDMAGLSDESNIRKYQEYVSFYISAQKTTLGNRFKQAIDDGTLETRFKKKVINAQSGRYVLDEIRHSPFPLNDVSVMFYDDEREQWVHSRPFYSTLTGGEGNIKGLKILVEYTYQSMISSDRFAMHQWAMKFVESLVISESHNP